ncbi:MAG TPA: nucleoside triphosphate pyrophosphohydrolase [Clostridiales bacterium]|nr:nucleoside triphosphate pyrophosphohydrolase [Clostridiales bacterium]
MKEKTKYRFPDLLEIMKKLRSPGGCPWDREQDHMSLKQYLIEETYEVLEAIDLEDRDRLAEELGDVLLQVVFHAQIAEEQGEFDMDDVTDRICRKMLDRHPHVFGKGKADTSEEVVSNWEAIKKRENGYQSQTQVLQHVPSNLPALMRSCKVQKKAALVGFDWDQTEDVLARVEEELREVKEVYQDGPEDRIREELGDLLFAVVNLCRFLGQEPEITLTAATEKFIRRFEYMEKNADRPLKDMNPGEMDSLWNQAKSALQREMRV